MSTALSLTSRNTLVKKIFVGVNVFFRKNPSKTEVLSNFTERKNDTGYIFININNDLGDAVKNGADDWPPLMLMAYAYARRAAVAALYIQGIVKDELYDHVKAVFKGMQVKTGHTVEFQEKAFDAAIDYMKGYSPAITKLAIRKIIQIAEEYEAPTEQLSDADLFESLVEMAALEQKENSARCQNLKPDLTSPFEPNPELQSEEGVRIYLERLSNFDHSTLCVEFANVRAAKYNLMSTPTGLNDFQKVQALITDLTDKSVTICIFVFGQPAVFGYGRGGLSSFNELVDKVDDSVSSLNLEPEQHGHQLLKRLRAHLQADNTDDDFDDDIPF